MTEGLARPEPAAADPAAAEIAVEAAGLAHRYAPGRGLEPVSFSIASPGVVAVTGKNGAGKSTLLRIIVGLLRPSAGTLAVTWRGARLADDGLRIRAGYAAPELSFYDEFTVAENLQFAAEARGGVGAGSAIDEALDRVGLSERAQDRVAALSSGMKQRLRLAFALLHRPALLALDEPGSHLDDPGREVVRALLERHRRSGLVVLATNDEREWSLADQRIELRGAGLGHST